MIDVEHRALGAFEQDPRSAPAQLDQPQPDRLGVGQEARRERVQSIDQLARSDGRLAECDPKRIVVQEEVVDLAPEQVWIGEIADANRAARDLVLVGRADASPCGAELAAARLVRRACCLAGAVELAMQRQDQRRVLGDPQVVRADRDALIAQRLDLVEQRPGVHDDAVADDRELTRANDARRQKAELVGSPVDHQGVARVVATLEADHHLGPLREPVDDLALALVAPLGADNSDAGHVALSPTAAG